MDATEREAATQMTRRWMRSKIDAEPIGIDHAAHLDWGVAYCLGCGRLLDREQRTTLCDSTWQMMYF